MAFCSKFYFRNVMGIWVKHNFDPETSNFKLVITTKSNEN